MTSRTWARLVGILFLDMFNKRNKESIQFSVKQKIKVREADDDINKEKQIWERNLVLFSQLSVFLKL